MRRLLPAVLLAIVLVGGCADEDDGPQVVDTTTTSDATEDATASTLPSQEPVGASEGRAACDEIADAEGGPAEADLREIAEGAPEELVPFIEAYADAVEAGQNDAAALEDLSKACERYSVEL